MAERIALTLSELARKLGLSPRTLQRQCAAGTFPIPHRVIGARRLFSVVAVERWLQEQEER